MTKKRLVCYLFGALAWLFIVGIGFSALMNYENTPGELLPITPSWPSQSKLRPDPKKLTLMMFIHPHCPCSRASIHELAELMETHRNQLKTVVLFYQPSGFPSDWYKTDSWEKVKQIQGVTALEDFNGVEMTRFHANISGQTLLFNPGKQLLFSGGLTAGRGQVGDNEGREKLSRLISREELKHDKRSGASVFGCPIFPWNAQQKGAAR